MKKLFIIPLCIIALLGCKKLSQEPIAPAAIIGKWYRTKTILLQVDNGVQAHDTTKYSDSNIYTVFGSDGTGTSSTKSGSSYIITKFNYTYQGTTLTVMYNNTSEKDAVSKLTPNELVIHYESSSIKNNIVNKMFVDDYFNR